MPHLENLDLTTINENLQEAGLAPLTVDMDLYQEAPGALNPDDPLAQTDESDIIIEAQGTQDRNGNGIDDPDDPAYQVIESTEELGKYIDNTADPLTQGEKLVIGDLVKQGKTVERIPVNPKIEGGTPDFSVDGVKTELKTLENANTNTGMKRIQNGFIQGAENVIIDARNSGLTKVQADEIIARAKGKYPNGQLPGTVEIWIDGQIVTYP